MALFRSSIENGDDDTLIQPSDWNAAMNTIEALQMGVPVTYSGFTGTVGGDAVAIEMFPDSGAGDAPIVKIWCKGTTGNAHYLSIGGGTIYGRCSISSDHHIMMHAPVITYNTDGDYSGIESSDGKTTLMTHYTWYQFSINNSAPAGAVFDFNTQNKDADTCFRTANANNTLYIDASADKVGIATSTPSEKLEINGNVKCDILKSQVVTVAGFSGSAVAGMIKYDSGHFYGYDGSNWKQLDNT
jgi:hypothetical protein